MHTRNLTLTFCLLLSGCLTNDPGQVSVVDKSFNISNPDLSTKVIASDSNNRSWVWIDGNSDGCRSTGTSITIRDTYSI